MRRRDEDELRAVEKWLAEHERADRFRHQYLMNRDLNERLIESYVADVERALILERLKANAKTYDDFDYEYEDHVEDEDDGDEFD